MKLFLPGILMLLGMVAARADRTWASVQWPGWRIETWEDSISSSYPLTNLADGSMRTAWVFNKASLPNQEFQPGPFNHGVGRTLRVESDRKLTLDGITLTNGYAKDSTTYWRNNRIKKISIEMYDGKSHAYTFSLRDTRDLQRCTFPRVMVSTITLKFEQVEAGRDDDLCISELSLLSNGKPVLWSLTPFVVTNDANTSCCGGTVLRLRTQGGLNLPGPDNKPLDFVVAAPQPDTHAMLLATKNCLYLFDMDRGIYLHQQPLPGELTLAPSIGWLNAHTAAVAVAPNYGDWEHQVWYEFRMNGGYHWQRTNRPAKKPPEFLPGVRGPYYSV